MSREFDVYTVLSVTHGLPVHLDPYLEILTHITGQPMDVVTAMRAKVVSTPWLLQQHPGLSEFDMPAHFESDAAMDAWAEQIATAIGAARLPVQPLPPGEWARRSLVEEVLDHVPPEKAFVVDPRRLP